MMYPLMALDDQTEIVYSDKLPDGRVKVYFERPDAKDCFHHATCYLPGCEWGDVHGFTEEELKFFQTIVQENTLRICPSQNVWKSEDNQKED